VAIREREWRRVGGYGSRRASMRRSNDGQKKPVLDNDTPLASEDDPIYKESWTISTLHGPTEPSKKS
jgi:hypothetical protein